MARNNKTRETGRWAATVGRKAFTLLELLVVISIIGVLAGFVVGLAPVAGAKMRTARVQSQLEALTTSIEQYKLRFGVYPPDNYNAVTGVTDPALNPLYYELSGVFVDNVSANPHFVTSDGQTALYSPNLQQWFNRDGILNAAPVGHRRSISVNFRESDHAQIFRSGSVAHYSPLEVLAVGFVTDATGKRGSGFAWPTDAASIRQFGQPVPGNPGLNPWRYVSTNPTNNPGSYDLWAEIIVRGEKKIIGNIKQ